MNSQTCICFLADRHDLYDDRIYWKMAVPLVKMGFEVHYLLIGKTNETGITNEGVRYRIFKLKTFSSNRFTNFILKRLNPFDNYSLLFKTAKKLKADIYHFHDLWLNRIGTKLKNLEHQPAVFYDAREPYAEDYVSYVKSPLPFLVTSFAKWVDHWEKKKAISYDLVIANEDTVRRNFAKKIGSDKSVVLYNYFDEPDQVVDVPLEERKYDLIYTGAITELRGALVIIEALEIVKQKYADIRLIFLGNYYPQSLKGKMQDQIIEKGLANNIDLHDAVSFREVPKFYNQSKIGLVLLQKVKTFEISMPIKIFEYMAFGLPVIGSDFGHMKDYLEKDRCGIPVSPTDAFAIAGAIISILKDEHAYKEYSLNGKRATELKYNWKMEFDKLLSHYKTALDAR